MFNSAIGHKIFLIFIFLIFTSIQFIPTARAGLSHDPALDWKTLHSKNFRLHYHNNAKQLAYKALAIAEQTHAKFSPIFDWQPEDPTDIILTDEFGLSNGYATPFPSNRSAIFLAPPDRLNSLEDYSDWLQTVITHEYVHILHLDKVNHGPKALRSIFGRFGGLWFFTVFPNAFQPGWVIEGLSTYYETDKERGVGRGQSSYFNMIMRMEVDAGVKTVRHVNQPTVDWPAGTIRYLYGVNFFNFVKERKGEEKIQAMVADMSTNWFPFLVNTNMKNTFGTGQGAIWDEFTGYLNQKYQPQIDKIEKSGIREGKQLTRHGYSTGASLVDDEGSLYYLKNDWRTHAALMVKRNGTDKAKHLTDVNFGATFDIHDTAGIVVAQAEICRNARVYFDLYLVNPKSGSKDKITNCGRYHYGAWMSDGKHIIAARLEMGKSSLHKLNLEGEVLETIWQARSGEILSGLDVSPDGKYLVSSVWRPNSGWNIEELELSSGKWRSLTATSTIEMQSRYTLDGKAILFSGDHGGVYNIRSLDRQTKKLVTLTNVKGGAFNPVLDTKSNSLYYTGYHSKGFDIYKVALAAQPLKTPAAKAGTSAAPEPITPLTTEVKETNYSPWATLRPRWWFPHVTLDDAGYELGVITSGWDVLEKHTYLLDLAYDVTNGWPVGSFDYIYDGWYVIPKLHASRYNEIQRSDNEDADPVRVRKHDLYQFEAILPWLKLDRLASLHVTALRDFQSDGWVEDKIVEEPDEIDNLAGAAIVYDSTWNYPRSISRSDGRHIRLVAENSEIIGGGDYTGGIYSLDWREYFQLFGEHVLSMRAVAGWGTGEPRPFRLGGSRRAGTVPSYLGSSVDSSPFNQRAYALRGYPTGLSILEGRRMQTASLEYRVPIFRTQRGITVPPIGLHQLHAAFFADTGGTWEDDENRPEKYYTGVGVELNTDIVFGYNFLLPLRIGFATGLDDVIGENQIYLQAGATY